MTSLRTLLLILVCLFVTLHSPLAAQHAKFRIWQNTSVHNRSVTLEPFLPEENCWGGMAVIVCPGGSYCWHDHETEGRLVAEWLRSEGIAAFVLNYRVQGIFPYVFRTRAIFGGHKHPDMISDLQRAIQLLREKAAHFGISPNRIGAMGFSAGGHLVMSGACFWHTDFLAPLGIQHTASLRPYFVAPIYPVVSMSHACTHRRSRRALLGEWGKHRRTLRDSLSLEKHVPRDCPPVFLVNCKDDPIVDYRNSELLDSALTHSQVSHQYIQYATGGHGFGASDVKGTQECRQWRDAFLKWLRKIN